MIAPVNFLEEAQELGAAAHNEVRRRTVVSRAYYAAHHAAKVEAVKRGFANTRDANVHQSLIAYLGDQEDPVWVKIARRLSDLRGWRNKADYKLLLTVGKNDFEDALFYADEIINELLPAVANGGQAMP